MPKRQYVDYPDQATGQVFRFADDGSDPSLLHLTARHGTTAEDAIATYFDGTTVWNPDRLRFETETETHVVFWAWHASGAVLVISCFTRGDR